jgi:hypothetical protein
MKKILNKKILTNKHEKTRKSPTTPPNDTHAHPHEKKKGGKGGSVRGKDAVAAFYITDIIILIYMCTSFARSTLQRAEISSAATLSCP